MEKVIISARVEYNIAEALAQIAESINAPRADVIKSAIELYIAKYQQGPAPLTTADRQEHAALRAAVRNLMIDGQWRTLAEMAEAREELGDYYVMGASRMHNMLDCLESGAKQIQELTAENERLRKRDGNATIILCCPTDDDPFKQEQLNIVDFGVSDNIYMVERASEI